LVADPNVTSHQTRKAAADGEPETGTLSDLDGGFGLLKGPKIAS
jgi:hypothetical protein